MSEGAERIRARGLATVGVVGAGHIAGAYLRTLTGSPLVRVTSLATRSTASAAGLASEFGLEPMTLGELLADDELDLVVDLTGAAQHQQVNLAVVAAGKHVYSEKPLAGSYADAEELLDAAASRGVLVGCAPDTLLGGGHQAAVDAVAAGAVGEPLLATAFFGLRRVRSFVPDLGAYFAGGGPLVDRSPYLVSQLVWLLGPVRSVVAHGLVHDTAGHDVPSTVVALLRFASGCVGQLTLSVDVVRHHQPYAEVHGSAGSLTLPDPNFFGGAPRLAVGSGEWSELATTDRPFTAENLTLPLPLGTVADHRGAGVLDMVAALVEGRPHRASGELAAHVVEVVEAAGRSLGTGREVVVTSTCARPEPLGVGAGLSG